MAKKTTYKRISSADDNSGNKTSTQTTTITSDTNDNSEDTNNVQDHYNKNNAKPTKPIQEKISDKLHAILFISLSYAVIQYTDTVSIVFTSTQIIRPLLYIAVVLMTINMILFLYLGVYIPKIKGIDTDKFGKTNGELWSTYCPRVIPIMTLNGVLCSIVMTRCFWPVWGFFTPIILGIEFFGLIFVSQFIPWC
jgi:hypothetical protein